VLAQLHVLSHGHQSSRRKRKQNHKAQAEGKILRQIPHGDSIGETPGARPVPTSYQQPGHGTTIAD